MRGAKRESEFHVFHCGPLIKRTIFCETPTLSRQHQITGITSPSRGSVCSCGLALLRVAQWNRDSTEIEDSDFWADTLRPPYSRFLCLAVRVLPGSPERISLGTGVAEYVWSKERRHVDYRILLSERPLIIHRSLASCYYACWNATVRSHYGLTCPHLPAHFL